MAGPDKKRKMTGIQPVDSVCSNKALNWLAGFSLLLLINAVVVAQTGVYTEVPGSYRTPLSDMIYEEHTDWRAPPEEDNPWREAEEEIRIKPRIKSEFFPKYDYNTREDPTTRNLFQNEDELERPRTNIFKYTF
jgi:hypothetical protein